jgi:peptidoglycan/xylan/chitin deacetylase (PgdA/CDA1 family)
MPLKSKLKNIASDLDKNLAAVAENVRPARSRLLVFTFHSLFSSAEETSFGLVDPQQKITTEKFRTFVAHFLEQGYQFASPEKIVAGLNPAGNHAMITFDDGYFNNLRALPVLEEFQIPAVFCISTNHVVSGKPFWWDVLYREGSKNGLSPEELDRARSEFKRMRTRNVENKLASEFGSACLRTTSDLDRPMNPDELRKLANHPMARIGNHTCDHAILTNYPLPEVREQIRGAKEMLGTLTGQPPLLIAYPNGNVSEDIVQTARDAGLAVGVTVQPGPNWIGRRGQVRDILSLKRFTLWGDSDIGIQCRIARSPLTLQAAFATVRTKMRGASA